MRAFIPTAVTGPCASNDFPVDLRLSLTFSTFKTHLESHLFNISFRSVWLYHWLFFFVQTTVKLEHQRWANRTSALGPQKGGCGTPSIFMKFDVWERWISIIGGAGTAFSCDQWHFYHCVQSSRSRLCCIRISKFVVITLQYITSHVLCTTYHCHVPNDALALSDAQENCMEEVTTTLRYSTEEWGRTDFAARWESRLQRTCMKWRLLYLMNMKNVRHVGRLTMIEFVPILFVLQASVERFGPFGDWMGFRWTFL